MIIKSMSRKVPSFGQLLGYIDREAGGEAYTLRHNLRGRDHASIEQEFSCNADLLQQRRNGVFLYHEIISISRAQGCAFRRIRPVVPTTSVQPFRGIRPPEDRCRMGMVFDVRLFGPRQRFRRGCPTFASNGRPIRGDERCEPDGRGSHRRRWVHRSRRAML